ncbi:chitinase-like protein Idgf4 isoform X2 [Agrilus planipennis]|uniref:Chitinase-like protein Idgf4 isoform X2 n=1 Tax=Agrilus planipennis TaxID=224129 RepID=A0A1W4X8W6_AGRPL|nr:chitinase-like protein Idgf4 isoform X2 [Agrilus planipennis]
MARNVVILVVVTFIAVVVQCQKTDNKVVCYYNSKGYFREGQGRFDLPFIEPALQYCTHLIYGYAGVNAENFKLVPLNEQFDVTRDHYRHITNLKRQYPGLRVLLSVGGDADDVDTIKYLTLLESVDHRLSFVNSAFTIVKSFGFDGLDIAWEFPKTKPKKIRSGWGSFWHDVKTTFVGDSVPDEKEAEHKEQFTALVREVKNAFRPEGFIVTITVNPNVNSSVYYDTRALIPNVDFVNLLAFDFYTPGRNPKEADYPSPLYSLIDRKPDENADAWVRHWLENGAPNNKLILGIPTYGRAWKMTEDSAISGVPPFKVKGAAEEGPYTKEPGLLSYPEVCAKISNPLNLKGAGSHLRKVGDPTKRYGVYAFRLPDENGENGVWVGYEDPDTAGNKAAYARAKGLGGVAIYDITLDDFRGLCNGEKFPVLKAAKFRL